MPVVDARDDAIHRRVALCVAFAAFNFQIDATAVVVAMPSVAASWSLTTSEVSLIILAYLLAAVFVFLPAGWAARHWRLDRLFLLGCVVMTLGTLLCAMAPSFPALLACRILQGLGAGVIAALGYAIIPAYLPPDGVAWGYGWLSTAAGVGMILGAPMGGLLADHASWRAIFLVAAVPLTLLVVAVLRWLPPDPGRKSAAECRYDILGAMCLAGGLAAATLGLSQAQELGWTSPGSAAMYTAAAVLLLVAAKPRRHCRPLFPSALLSNRRYTGSLVNTFAITATTGGYAFILPFYLHLHCHLPLSVVSLVILAGSASFVGGAQSSGPLARGWGSRRLVLGGMAGAAVTSAVFGLSVPWGGAVAVAAFWLLSGLLRGQVTPVNNALAMEGIASEWLSEAAVMIPLVLNIGTTIGVSVFETLFAMHFPGGAAHHAAHARAPELMLAGMETVFLAGATMLAAASLWMLKTREGEAWSVPVPSGGRASRR